MEDKTADQIECNVGRLIEVRFRTPHSIVDVARFSEKMRRKLSALSSPSVICGDWRSLRLLSPEVADSIVEMFSRVNPRLERSGILLSIHDASLRLQIDRVVRQAGNGARRAFLDAGAMRSWLGEVLTDAERHRMNAFLIDDPG